MDKQAYEASVRMVLEKRASENVPNTEGADRPELPRPPVQSGVGMTVVPLTPGQIGLNKLRQLPRNMRYATSNLLHRLGGNANPPPSSAFRELKPQPPRNWLQRGIQSIAYNFDKYSGQGLEYDRMLEAEGRALENSRSESFNRQIRKLEQESEKMRNDAWSGLLPQGSTQTK